MNYTTYWSILETSSQTIKSNTVCLIVAISSGLLWLLIKILKKENVEGDKIILLWGSGIFSFLAFVMYFALTFFLEDNANSLTLKMLNSHSTPRVEGIISDFQRSYRDTKETIETFRVDSVQFAYGDAVFGKFNSFIQTNNKVIFNGQQVRVTYKAWSPYGKEYNSILKLEIAR